MNMVNQFAQQSACYCAVLKKAVRRVSALYDAHLRRIGLKSTQFALLGELSRHRSESPTVNELADYLVMDRSTLGHNLRPLLRRRLVALKPDSKDGRTRRVTLTTKGAVKYTDGEKLWRKAQQEYETVMGKTAAVALHNALQKLATFEAR
jgi:DNA-binding MarR family transcriptional regulator